MVKIGSDFSGVGSFNQALIRLGIKYDELFACDMDKYARQTFELNFGKPKYYPENVYNREIPEESLDIYVTSPPCQAFSMAGKRMGKDDYRGILFFNSLEFIKVNKPRYFIFENVKGLLSHDKVDPKAEFGRTFQEWINHLGGKSINGVHTFFPYEDSVPYHIYFQVLNAKHYGVPQNRERVFIIGIRDDEDNNFTFPKPFPLEKRLKDVLETEVDEKYFLSEKMLDYLTTRKDNFNNGNINFKDENSVASTITKSSSSLDISDNIINLGNVNPSGNGMNGNVFSENGISPTLSTNKGEGIKIGTWRTHEDGKGFREMEDELCPTIPARAREDGSGQPVVKILGYTRDEKGKVISRHEQDLANTIHTATGGGGSTDQFVQIKSGIIVGRNPENPKSRKSGLETEQMVEINEDDSVTNTLTTVQKDNVIIYDLTNDFGEGEKREYTESSPSLRSQRSGLATNYNQRIRRLTPKECMRLMDFNQDFIERTINSKLISDSQLYKQCGNSIVVQMFVEILKKLNIK